MVNCCCGLLTLTQEPVPLKSVEVEVEVRDHVATVVSTLNYENQEDNPLEAVFVFPLPGDAAVCHFSAKIGQTEIVAEVKEKQKAREEYDDALSSGRQAFILEESEQSPDIFSLSVGCLPPKESASIRLEYVTELAVQADDGLRFCLPTVLNPRYQPQGSGDQGGSNIRVTSIPASKVPYSLSFCARVSSPRPVVKIESNCSLDPLQYLNTEQTQATTKLAAGHKFDRDVEVLIYYKDAHQPTAVVEAGEASAKPGTLMGDPAVMLSLYPEFPQSVMSSVTSCGEFVCLLDRSGSMRAPMNNRKNPQRRIGSARDSHCNRSTGGHSRVRRLRPLRLRWWGSLPLATQRSGTQRLTVHRLAARALIRSLEMKNRESKDQQDESVKKKVVELSVQSGVSSAFTAFVAVNKGDGEAIQGPLVLRDVETPKCLPATESSTKYHCQRVYFQIMVWIGKEGDMNTVDWGWKLVDNRFLPAVYFNLSAAPGKGGGFFSKGIFKMEKSKKLSLKSCKASTKHEFSEPSKPPMDPLLQLVSLQKASGCWVLGPDLAAAVGKTSEEVEKQKPALVNKEVWATILSLIWLHGFKIDAKEEWELLAMKAVSWLRAQHALCVEECVDAGNALLGCKVQKGALGL
ncbi:von Willebrand factor A domain-containing protein 5A-like [Cheilinus undulatus]|uniref:von Willebrand factor A domain-containing protein 5A-like n=1 Tax=Cheilinus undulatus TaxID=241271 RepID=UPI001BD56138|nr:von Willebrand factor A domain-containing protein 5A-like [Cheilinus undulatus]